MRLIDADALAKVLNDFWLATSPREHDDKETALERAAMCRGIDDCIKYVHDFPNGWISVKDDLPKEFGEPCIVYDGSSVQYGDYFSNSEWYTPDCYESDEIRGVTHWMPLPKPPKEEKEDA